MQIKRLKLSGFKSFVDATELRIEPGLTGIVGPNGCGKSNLLEAIRWVMGESSAKSMRGGGMEDVIFAGTATRPQRDFAEVSLLTVQEQGELFSAVDIGPDGELEVTRRIERQLGCGRSRTPARLFGSVVGYVVVPDLTVRVGVGSLCFGFGRF